MTPYLIISTADGTRSRRVDFGAIAEIFAEDPQPKARPHRLTEVAATLRSLPAAVPKTMRLLRGAASRRVEPNRRPARALSV